MSALAEPTHEECCETTKRQPTPSVRSRILVALAVGAFFGLAMWAGAIPERTDFAQIWFGGRALLSGISPYSVVGPGRAFGWEWPLYYPLPAIVVTSPMALMSLRDGMAFFTALSCAAFAFAITRDGWWRVPLLASAPLAYAVGLVQWSPLLTATALLPSLGILLVTKPSIGLAIWLYRPTLRAVVGGLFLVLVSIVIWPTWIAEWRMALESANHMVLPIAHGGGPLLVLALLRWRRPEARLLLALACVPQTALLYGVVPLLLVPATLVESFAFSVLSWITLLIWTHMAHPALYRNLTLSSAKLIVPLLYLPCLIMVLRRPNEGRLPSWMERLAVPSSIA